MVVSSDPVAEAHEPPGGGEQHRGEREIGDVHHARLRIRDLTEGRERAMTSRGTPRT
jgi:hypothetical protein